MDKLTKAERLEMRITAPLKRAIERAAIEERRSVASLVEVVMADWLASRRNDLNA